MYRKPRTGPFFEVEMLPAEHGDALWIEYGDAAAEICRVAEGEHFDVIVVGSHGSGFVKRVFLGSVSQHLLHHAPVPVLVVRATDHS